jgi:hypothetical protein
LTLHRVLRPNCCQRCPRAAHSRKSRLGHRSSTGVVARSLPFMLCSTAFAEGRPMRHLTAERSAPSSGTGPAQPGGPLASRPRTARKRPHRWAPDLSDCAPDPQRSVLSGFVRTAPKPPPNGTEVPAPPSPPSQADRSHPLHICPIAHRRASQPPPNPPDRTRRPRRTPICPIGLPPAPFAPAAAHTPTAKLRRLHPRPASGICPIALSARDARRLEPFRAHRGGNNRPTRGGPLPPPTPRAAPRRRDLRAPKRPCPFAP